MTNDIKISRELAELMLGSADSMGWSWADKLRALLAAPVVERQEPVEWQRKSKMHGDCWYPLQADDVEEARNSGWEVRALYASPPAPAAVALHPFADKVIRKLQRFQECADDGQGADIGRHWFDLLTQLGLLNRVQRSPALWEITQQGEDCIDKVKEMNK